VRIKGTVLRVDIKADFREGMRSPGTVRLTVDRDSDITPLPESKEKRSRL
jgi:hypothetical protein